MNFQRNAKVKVMRKKQDKEKQKRIGFYLMLLNIFWYFLKVPG